MAQVMPWEEYQPTPAGGGQGVVIQPEGPTPIQQAQEQRAQTAEQRAQASAAREDAKFSAEMTGKGGKPTEAQQKAATLVTRIAGGFQDIENIIAKDKSAQEPGLAETVRGGLQTSGLLAPITRKIAGADRRIVHDAQRDVLDALLTLGTGAAYSPAQLDAQMGAYFPQYGDTPEETDFKNNRMMRLIESAKENAGPLGDKVDEVLQKFKMPEQAAQEATPVELTAGQKFSTEEDKAIAAAVNQVFAQGGGVQELVAAAEGAGGQVSPDDLAAFNQAIELRAKGQPVNFEARQTGTRSPIAQAAGEALMTPAGTALTGAVNAAGMGMLSQFAGDQVQGLEALNPKAALTGEIIGSALGTAGLAKGAAAGLKAVAPKMAERLAGGGLVGAGARELATEAAYGGGYAANTGQDIGTGMALGAVGSLGGQALGAGVRRAAPVVGRMLGREGAPPVGGEVPPMGGATPGSVPEEPFIPTTTRSTDTGAAGTSEETIRAQRAQELPVPIELARFQRSRLFTEQQRARELAKNNEIGGPIRERLSEQQEALRQNFDKFIDETGSEVWENAREKGVVVDSALKKLADIGKTRTRILYKRAEKAGEMQEPIPYKGIKAFIDEQDVTTREKLAPVLDAVANQLRKNDPEGTGQIPINALENVRKLINKVAQPGTPDATFGAELKGLIDEATVGKGGELYQQARAARIKYANTFENAGLVKKLMGTKPGTVDRQVALEKVAEQAIYSRGTALDDIKALKGVLDQASTRGERAWKELQGATLEHIRDQAYKGITRDESGKPVISAAALDRIITDLDRTGKLDYVLGQKTANLLRTVNDVAKDIVTAPPGSINTSGTSSAILNALDTAATFGVSGIPIPTGKLIGSFKNAMQNRELRKEVKRLLD